MGECGTRYLPTKLLSQSITLHQQPDLDRAFILLREGELILVLFVQ